MRDSLMLAANGTAMAQLRLSFGTLALINAEVHVFLRIILVIARPWILHTLLINLHLHQ
jgi:hypothetical protein